MSGFDMCVPLWGCARYGDRNTFECEHSPACEPSEGVAISLHNMTMPVITFERHDYHVAFSVHKQNQSTQKRKRGDSTALVQHTMDDMLVLYWRVCLHGDEDTVATVSCYMVTVKTFGQRKYTGTHHLFDVCGRIVSMGCTKNMPRVVICADSNGKVDVGHHRYKYGMVHIRNARNVFQHCVRPLLHAVAVLAKSKRKCRAILLGLSMLVQDASTHLLASDANHVCVTLDSDMIRDTDVTLQKSSFPKASHLEIKPPTMPNWYFHTVRCSGPWSQVSLRYFYPRGTQVHIDGAAKIVIDHLSDTLDNENVPFLQHVDCGARLRSLRMQDTHVQQDDLNACVQRHPQLRTLQVTTCVQSFERLVLPPLLRRLYLQIPHDHTRFTSDHIQHVDVPQDLRYIRLTKKNSYTYGQRATLCLLRRLIHGTPSSSILTIHLHYSSYWHPIFHIAPRRTHIILQFVTIDRRDTVPCATTLLRAQVCSLTLVSMYAHDEISPLARNRAVACGRMRLRIDSHIKSLGLHVGSYITPMWMYRQRMS